MEYKSSGKKYNGEKAIISLTSWKARINTVSKTLFSLLKMCPGFHIVLVLSEEEFPKREDELPENLRVFVDNKLIELLWVYKNYKALKKVLFTMDKYRNIPVISADDDCIYTCNYAEQLYNKLEELNKENCIIRFTRRRTFNTQGPCTLFNIKSEDVLFLLSFLNKTYVNMLLDDDYYSKYLRKLKYKIFNVGAMKLPFIFHDDFKPITKNQRTNPIYKFCFI